MPQVGKNCLLFNTNSNFYFNVVYFRYKILFLFCNIIGMLIQIRVKSYRISIINHTPQVVKLMHGLDCTPYISITHIVPSSPSNMTLLTPCYIHYHPSPQTFSIKHSFIILKYFALSVIVQ